MELSLIIVQKIAVMFLLTLVGYICAKLGVIDTPTTKRLSTLALKLVSPMLIFSSYQMEYDPVIVKNLGISFVMCAIAYVIQIGAAFLLARSRGGKNPGYRLERLCMIFSNCGFFGIPLIHSLYGAEGTVYLTAFIAVFNVLLWAVGVPILVGKTTLRDTVKNVFSPATVATVLGLGCLLLRLRLPAILIEPIEMIGSMNTPFAMIAAGATIAGTKLLPAVKNPRIYYTTFCKMLLIPAAAALIFTLFPLDPLLVTVPILAVACPVAIACPMLALLYGHDESFGSQMFAVTTLLSIVTIPLIFLFATVLGL